MNLLLLDPDELDPDGRATLTDRRAAHLGTVLRVEPGRSLRCGIVDGPLGEATVVAAAPGRVEVACRFDTVPPPRPEDVLLLAAPRPKVLRRVVEDATALGFGTIVVLRTWRVDRSHLESHACSPDALAPHARAGMEQSRRTWQPTIAVAPLFRPFVEDRLDAIATPRDRYAAHPGAAAAVEAVAPRGPLTLAVGPERGFTGYELECLAARGFVAVHGGPHPLRVETAVAALGAQLQLLRRMSASEPVNHPPQPG